MSLMNYDPSLFELYETVFRTKQEVVLQFPDLAKASNFALKMQRLRRDMRKENHHMLVMAETIEVSVDRKKFTASVRPQGYSYIGQVQAALARLNEISPEVQEHELENTSIHGHARRLDDSQNKESEIPPPTSFRKDNAGSEDKAGPSPQEEALKAFMKKGD